MTARVPPPRTPETLGEERRQDPPEGVYVLPLRSLAACVVACLAVFFAVGDPLGDPFHLDQSVMWSYYAAPLCVAGALVAHARLGLSAWLLNTLFVALVKFALTYAAATALWAASAPNAHRPERSRHDHADGCGAGRGWVSGAARARVGRRRPLWVCVRAAEPAVAGWPVP